MQFSLARKRFFTEKLIEWHHLENDRSLPWKKEKDPYKIWLSEIILQQTRAEQGLPYYLAFTDHYPTVTALAGAQDEEVFRLWQGLGYYNRCRNLLTTARMIGTQFNGIFPERYEDIRSLKGIGPYTAAAIASFAYGLPYAVVDGNVNRVLSRYFGIETPVDIPAGKKMLQELADNLLYKEDTAAYNQAIMDLGATICKPANPSCDICPVRQQCIALKNNLISLLPVKTKKPKIKKRFFHYLFIVRDQALWITERTGKDIWQHLYQPILIEAEHPLDAEQVIGSPQFHQLGIKGSAIGEKGKAVQRLTHQIIESRFFTLYTDAGFQGDEQGQWVHIRDLKKYAFPKTLVSFLEKNFYF